MWKQEYVFIADVFHDQYSPHAEVQFKIMNHEYHLLLIYR